MTKRKHRHCSYNNVRLPVDLWVGDVASLVIAMNLTCANKQYCLCPTTARAKSGCSQPQLPVPCGNALCFLSFTLDKQGIYLKEKMEITKCLFITVPWFCFCRVSPPPPRPRQIAILNSRPHLLRLLLAALDTCMCQVRCWHFMHLQHRTMFSLVFQAVPVA